MHRVGALARVAIDSENQDVLRSAVVFLHATLEDFLRSLAMQYLVSAEESVLNEIPFAGNARAEKFWLGKLAQFRGRTVDEVIADSVRQHLNHSTYNSAGEVAGFLESISFDVKHVRDLLPEVDAMMKRRHQIVHRADRDDDNRPATLDLEAVMNWITATNKLMAQILALASNREAITAVQGALKQVIDALEKAQKEQKTG